MRFEQPVINVMTENPVTITKERKISEARALFADERIHHLPVVEGNKLVGIVSSSDLVRLSLMYDRDDESLNDFLDSQYTIDSIMQRHPITIGVEYTVREAARVLSIGGFHALPVVGYDGDLKGIVTSTDLIELLMEKL